MEQHSNREPDFAPPTRERAPDIETDDSDAFTLLREEEELSGLAGYATATPESGTPAAG